MNTTPVIEVQTVKHRGGSGLTWGCRRGNCVEEMSFIDVLYYECKFFMHENDFPTMIPNML